MKIPRQAWTAGLLLAGAVLLSSKSASAASASGSMTPPPSGNPGVADFITVSQEAGVLTATSAATQLHAIQSQVGSQQRKTEYHYAYMDIQAAARNALNAINYNQQQLNITFLTQIKGYGGVGGGLAYNDPRVVAARDALETLRRNTIVPYQLLLDKLNKAYTDIPAGERIEVLNA